MTEAIVAGHICIDIIPEFDASASSMSTLVAPGRLTEVGPAALSTGGAVSNTGLNLHRLGIHTALMGKIGEDLFGHAILDVVRRYGAELTEGMVITPGAVSSYTVVINPPGTDRAFLHCAGANHTFGADDVRYDLLEHARLFHFGYPPLMRRTYEDGGVELAEMFRRAKATGVTTSLDMAMPDLHGASGAVDWRGVLARTLPHVDIFTPSFEELLFMLARPRFDELDATGDILGGMTLADVDVLAAQVEALGGKVLLLKMGRFGAYLRTPGALMSFGRAAPDYPAEPPVPASWLGRELWSPAFEPTRLVGTTGAGDAAIAGFLAAVLRGREPEDALTMATAVGACNVEAASALDGVLSWDETVARINAGWARQTFDLDAPGWQWDDARGLWHGPHDLA